MTAPEALRGGDRLQSGDAGTEDEHARRLDRARGRHQHRHEAAVLVGRQNHGLVAGDVALRREDVHRLRARDTRQQFHGEGRHAGLRQRFDAEMRAQEADDDATRGAAAAAPTVRVRVP